MDTSEFVKERNEAFLSKDINKIKAYCEKYGIEIPKDERILWLGVHKAICNLYLAENSPITLEQYQESYDWLERHGSNPSIMGGEE